MLGIFPGNGTDHTHSSLTEVGNPALGCQETDATRPLSEICYVDYIMREGTHTSSRSSNDPDFFGQVETARRKEYENRKDLQAWEGIQ